MRSDAKLRITAARSGVNPSTMRIDSVLRRDQSRKNQSFKNQYVENESTEENHHNDYLVETRFIENLAFHKPELRDYREDRCLVCDNFPCSAILSTCRTIAAETIAALYRQNTLEIDLGPADPVS